MKNTFIVLGLLVTSCGAPVFAQNGSTNQPLARRPEVAAAIAVLDAWVAATAASREQPGLSLGIVYDQDLIWAKGYGFADLATKVPAKPSTVYRIASISKLFTTTAILQLRDAGKLQLDDPVAKYLPWFKAQSRASGRSCNHHPAFVDAYLGVAARGRGHELERLDHAETRRHDPASWRSRKQCFQRRRNGSIPIWIALAGEIVAAVSGNPWPSMLRAVFSSRWR